MKKLLRSLLFLPAALFINCSGEDVTPEPAFTMKLYSPEVSANIIMNLEYGKGAENIYAYGSNYSYGLEVDSYVHIKQNDEMATVMVADLDAPQEELEVFFFTTNKNTFQEDDLIMSVQPIDDNRFYVNYFSYDWQAGKGNLIYKFIYDSQKQKNERVELLLNYDNGEEGARRAEKFSAALIDNKERANSIGQRSGTADDLDEFIEKQKEFFTIKLHPIIRPIVEFMELVEEKTTELGENAKNRTTNLLDKASDMLKKLKGSTEKVDQLPEENEPTQNQPVQYIDDPESPEVENIAEAEEDLVELARKLEELQNRQLERPDVCNQATSSGGHGVTTNTHFLGVDPGTVVVSYSMYNAPDEMSIVYNGEIIESTGGKVSGNGSLSFYFGGEAPYEYQIVVIGGQSGTLWDYVASCPE